MLTFLFNSSRHQGYTRKLHSKWPLVFLGGKELANNELSERNMSIRYV
jgi:hypothetical protein